MSDDGIVCQLCGVEAPTRHVEFHQNIGALVMRFSRSVKGQLCKNCVHSQFWQKTGITLGIGWLGTISLILAPVFVLMNTVQYLRAIGMPPTPKGALPPRLDATATERLGPVTEELFERLNRGEALAPVALDLGPRVGVTPGQVVMYLRAIAAAQRAAAAPARTYGFPVGMATPPPLPVQSLAALPVAPAVAMPLPPLAAPAAAQEPAPAAV